jgi:hypothetical protein
MPMAPLTWGDAMSTRILGGWCCALSGLVAWCLLGGGSAALAVTLQANGSPTTGDANLRLWLDASDLSTLWQDTGGTIAVTSNGQTVALWKDKSGNALNVSQTGTAKPDYLGWITNLNLRPGLHFDVDVLQAVNSTGITGNDDRTVITVWTNSVNTTQNFQHTFHMGTADTNRAYGISVSRASSNLVGNHYWAGEYTTNKTGNAVPHMALASWDGDGGTPGSGLDSWYVDGRFGGTSNRDPLNTGADSITIGSRLLPPAEGIRGDIAEVIVYDSTLTAAEQQAIGRYLTNKYRLDSVYLGNGNVYQVVSANLTWAAAQAAAQALTPPTGYTQGNLVSITSLRENRAVASLISTSAWIGANDAASEGAWVWSDGSGQFWQGLGSGAGGQAVRGQFSAWNGAGEPNDASGEDYAAMYTGGVWNDLSGTATAGSYVVKFTPKTTTSADFDSTGTPNVITQYGSLPGASIQNLNATSNYLRLLNNVGNEQNVIAFDRTAAGSYGRITASFDFRMDAGADGFGFALLNTGNYETTGAGPGIGAWEEPNLTNSFGAGFDVYDGIHEVSLHWNGATAANANSLFDYRTGSTGAFNNAVMSVDFVRDGAYVSLSVGGTAVYTDQFIAGMTPYEARLAIGGRTGGAFTTLDVDNINVQYFRDTIEWGGGTGSYTDAALWTGGRTPSVADHAVIAAGQANSTDLVINGPGDVIVAGTGTLNNSGTLWIAQAAGYEPTLYQRGGTVNTAGLYISGASGALGYYEMTGGVLNLSSYLVVGHSGAGTFLQTAGTVNQTGTMTILGDVSGSQGSLYEISGGTLNAYGLSVADKSNTTAAVSVSGTGVLNTAGTAYVGMSGIGLLSVAGTGTQAIHGDLRVGQNGGAVGIVQQSGGTVNVDGWLILGEAGGSLGSYDMSGNAVLNVGGAYLIVGRSGKGTFTQSGNSVVNVNVAERFMICDFGGAAGSSYTISGGTLNVNNGKLMAIGKGASGEFLQTGGTVNATGDLSLGEESTGTYKLRGGALNVTGNVINGIGTGRLEFDGGTLSVGGPSIDVDSLRMAVTGSANPTLTLGSGKSLRVRGDMSVGENQAATANFTNAAVVVDGRLWAGQNAGGNGTITQTNGSVTVGGWLAISDNPAALGSYTLGGAGTLTINGDYLIVGRQGPGTFVQNDSSVVTLNVSQRLLIADNPGSSGSVYTLNGGTLNVNNGREISIGKAGTGLFTQNAGTVNNPAGTLRLGEGSNSGTYQLKGGTLDIRTIVRGSGGAFEFTGGTLHAANVQFALLNQGGTLSPGHSAGTTLIDGAGAQYDQLAPGILGIELGGYTAGTEFDLLDVAGPANLAGSLQVSLIDGFVPVTGDTFNVVTATDVTLDPDFALIQPTGLAASNYFVMNVISGGARGEILQLTLAVPEPATLVLFGLGGAIALAVAARRRRPA